MKPWPALFQRWVENQKRIALRIQKWFPPDHPTPRYQKVAVWAMVLTAIIVLACLWFSP